MTAKKKTMQTEDLVSLPVAMPKRSSHGRIFSEPVQGKYLDPLRLHLLEQSFRDWTAAAVRPDIRRSRHRILLVFLLIRYTGAKLNEVLGLDPVGDIDLENKIVQFGSMRKGSGRCLRTVQLSGSLCREIRTLMAGLATPDQSRDMFRVDPGYVRRKFYERAEACGIPKQLGAPENLRRSRAVELMQSNMPLPAVQRLMGHATPGLASTYVSFSEEDIQQVTRLFMEKESARKTSARNTFFGRIHDIRRGDVLCRVEMVTLGGHRLTTIITSDSLQRLGLKEGKLITAEVKAPWVMLQKNGNEDHCSADNMFSGTVEKITRGELTTECIVRLVDGTEVCSVVTSESCRRLALAEGDDVQVVFTSYSVVLLAE